MKTYIISASDAKLSLALDDEARLSVTGLNAYGHRMFTECDDELDNLLMVGVRGHTLAGKYPLSTFKSERARMEDGRFTCDLVNDTLPLSFTLGIRPAGHTLEFSAQACWMGDNDVTLDIFFPFFVNIGLTGAQFIMPRLSGAVYPSMEEYNICVSYIGNLSAPFHMIQDDDIGLVVLDKSRTDYQVDPGMVMRRAHFNANDASRLDDMIKSEYFSEKRTEPTGAHFHGIVHTRVMRARTEPQKKMQADIEDMGDVKLGQGSDGSMWFGDYVDLGPVDVYTYQGNWKVGADYVRKARSHLPMYEANADWVKHATFLGEDKGDVMVKKGQTYYDLSRIFADKRSSGSDLFMFVGFHQPVRLNSPMVFNWINRGDYQIAAENMGGFVGAKRGIEALHRQGGHVICYVEALIMWKLSRIGLNKGQKWALMNADGEYCEHYKGFWHMCPSCDEWISYLAETCAELVRDWHVNGFFIDSLCATFTHECHNPEHHHPHPYTWNWGVRRLLRAVREAVNKVNPDTYILVEGCSDIAREYADSFLSHTNPWLGGCFLLPVTRFVYPRINVFEAWGNSRAYGELDSVKRNLIFNFVNGCLIYSHVPEDESLAEMAYLARRYHDLYPELSECQISMHDAETGENIISQLFECKEGRILSLGNTSADEVTSTVRLPFNTGALFDRMTGKYIELTENACEVVLQGHGIAVFDVIA